jgi:hypothetical protein
MNFRIPAQEFGRNEDFYMVRFGGHGQLGAVIPPEYDAYLDGRKLEPDPATRRVTATVHRDSGYNDVMDGRYSGNVDDSTRPATLMAFKRLEDPLVGPWIDLPFYSSNDSAKWIRRNDEGGFRMSVAAIGRFLRRFPDADPLCIEGEYQVNQDGMSPPATGVIRINGKVVLKIPPGDPPFPTTPFKVDISTYAGAYALIEFLPDARFRGTGSADWIRPRISAGPGAKSES